MHIIHFFNFKSQLFHKKQPTAAHCGQSRALLRSPLGSSTIVHSPRFSLAKPDLASHCIHRLETGSFERNCFRQENLTKSLFQKSNHSRSKTEKIPVF